MYFTFRPENQPDLEQSKIVFLLKKILQDNPLATPPRVYRAKFFLSFEERPDSNVLRDIYDVMKKQYPECRINVTYDHASKRDLCTLYVGKMLGVDKQLMEKFLDHMEIKYKEVRVPIDKVTHKQQRFGYIEFDTQEEAAAAIPLLNGQKVGLSDGLRVVPLVDK